MLFCTPFKAHLLAAQLELIELGLLSEAVAMERELGVNMYAEEADKLLRKMRRYVKKCKRKEGPALRVKTKNLVECRNSFLANFIKHCTYSAKKCMYCLAPVRLLRNENCAKIFLKGLSRKHARAWQEARRIVSKKKRLARQVSEEGDAEDVTEEDVTEEACPSVESLTKQNLLTPLEVRNHVKQLWENQRLIVNAIVGCSVIAEGEEGERELAAVVPVGRGVKEISPADVFFLDVIPVAPSRFRPVSGYEVGDCPLWGCEWV